jgi:hypothetical protein
VSPREAKPRIGWYAFFNVNFSGASHVKQYSYMKVIRDVLSDDGIVVDEVTQLGYIIWSRIQARSEQTRGVLERAARSSITKHHQPRPSSANRFHDRIAF